MGEAADGVEAVALAHFRAAGIILTNVWMPQMAGIAATRLFSHSATGAPINVLVVTTFDLDEVVFDEPELARAGVVSHQPHVQ